MDYIFYQVAAINGFDSFGHYLRAGADRQPVLHLRDPRRRFGCSANFSRAASSSAAQAPPSPASARRGAAAAPQLALATRARARRSRRRPRPRKAGAHARPRGGRPGGRSRARGRRRPRPRPPRPLRRRPTERSRPRRCSTTCSEATNEAAAAAIAGNPVLIGAATILVVLVAVFLAYNANKGLPFVPTYQLRAEVPSAANLVVGNDVRIGGSRVGFVDGISARAAGRRHDDRGPRPHARARRRAAAAGLDADRPPALGARPQVRRDHPRHRQRGLRRGRDDPDRPGHARRRSSSTRSSACSTRRRATAIAANTTGFGDAFAGRGESINTAIGAFRPLLRDIVPVAQNLASPETNLRRFFGELGDAAAIVAPAAEAQAELFVEPRHHLPRAARGRAPVHPGVDHRRRAGARHRDPHAARSSGRSCATARACSASCSRAPPRCAGTRRRSPTRSWRAPARCRARRPSTAASRRCSTSCRPSPRTRRCRRGLAGHDRHARSRSTRRWRTSPRPRPSATT